MLSYRHAFHAGNHADVLKHLIQVQLLNYLNQKDKAYWYIDSHAGAGLYELDSAYASKNAEYRGGIGRLWQRNDLPPAVAEYVKVVENINPDGALRFYPGSPWVAHALLRDSDKLRLFELHSSDSKLLCDNFNDFKRRAQIQAADGFSGLKSVLPPPPRRGLILIDPPYEDKRDYQHVVRAVEESLSRFATGTYAIWYPMLQRTESRQLVGNLQKLPLNNWLHVNLTVQKPSADGFGMHGSGMFIINPPWTLPQTLQQTLPWLQQNLAVDQGASYTLDWNIA